MAHFCQNAERRHFAKRGHLYCKKHFSSIYSKLPEGEKFQFLFRDVYSRGLTKALRELPLSRELDRHRKSPPLESDGGLYTVPVVLSHENFNYGEEKK